MFIFSFVFQNNALLVLWEKRDPQFTIFLGWDWAGNREPLPPWRSQTDFGCRHQTGTVSCSICLVMLHITVNNQIKTKRGSLATYCNIDHSTQLIIQIELVKTHFLVMSCGIFCVSLFIYLFWVRFRYFHIAQHVGM